MLKIFKGQNRPVWLILNERGYEMELREVPGAESQRALKTVTTVVSALSATGRHKKDHWLPCGLF